MRDLCSFFDALIHKNAVYKAYNNSHACNAEDYCALYVIIDGYHTEIAQKLRRQNGKVECHQYIFGCVMLFYVYLSLFELLFGVYIENNTAMHQHQRTEKQYSLYHLQGCDKAEYYY